jgi:hypothetical protein
MCVFLAYGTYDSYGEGATRYIQGMMMVSNLSFSLEKRGFDCDDYMDGWMGWMYLRSDKLYTIGTHLRQRQMPAFFCECYEGLFVFCAVCWIGETHGLAAVVVIVVVFI